MINTSDTIRYRPDGSIDTNHYIAVGRTARSAQALRLTGKAASACAPRRLGVLATIAALLFVQGGPR